MIRMISGWKLKFYWLFVAKRQPWERLTVLGRPGWKLTIRDPLGGWSTIPGHSKFACWRRLLANPINMGYCCDHARVRKHYPTGDAVDNDFAVASAKASLMNRVGLEPMVIPERGKGPRYPDRVWLIGDNSGFGLGNPGV